MTSTLCQKGGTIILFRRGARALLVYGFSKSQRANISDDEEEQFKEAAKQGDFMEVKSE